MKHLRVIGVLLLLLMAVAVEADAGERKESPKTQFALSVGPSTFATHNMGGVVGFEFGGSYRFDNFLCYAPPLSGDGWSLDASVIIGEDGSAFRLALGSHYEPGSSWETRWTAARVIFTSASFETPDDQEYDLYSLTAGSGFGIGKGWELRGDVGLALAEHCDVTKGSVMLAFGVHKFFGLL